MQAEEYLNRYNLIDDIVSDLEEQYEDYVKIANGLGDFSASERVQTSRNLHSGQNAIINYIDIENKIKKLKQEKESIYTTLQRLPYYEFKVLRDYYIKDLGLKAIAYDCKKSYDWAKKEKRKALEHLQLILDEKRADL